MRSGGSCGTARSMSQAVTDICVILGGMPADRTPKTALGARLRDLRLSQEWTQRDLAELLSTQTNRISDWEIGKHEPTLPLLQRIAAVYDLTVAQLLKGVM